MDFRQAFAASVVALLAVLIAPLGATGGGRAGMCEQRLQNDLEPGEYEIHIVAKEHQSLIYELVAETAASVMSIQPLRFTDAKFRFVVSDSFDPSLEGDRGEDKLHRAYIILTDANATDFSNQFGSDDVITAIPPMEKAEIVSALKQNPMNEEEYYGRMALHSVLRTLQYWDHSHSERVMQISFEHMLSNPE